MHSRLLIVVLLVADMWLSMHAEATHHWWSIFGKLHSDWRRSGQRVHGRCGDVLSWGSTLLQHKGEDLAGSAVDSQLIAIQALADIVLGVAEVAGPANANLSGGALQSVVGASLRQRGEAKEGQSQSDYCKEEWGEEEVRICWATMWLWLWLDSPFMLSVR